MTNLLSIITPCYRPDPKYLEEAYQSILQQQIPQTWDWEWVIQEDGYTEEAENILPEDPRIKIANGRHSGVALTRNLALARSRGALIKNLDADDMLAPEVLQRDIDTLASNPLIQWTTSRVLDLLPDGTTLSFGNDPPAGSLPPGFVMDHWVGHNYRLPVHPTTICIRRPLVIALGGWMAVPGSDDTGLLTAASVISTGYFHQEVGLFYRKWAGQETAQTAHVDPTELQLRISLIRERAQYLSEFWPQAQVPS